MLYSYVGRLRFTYEKIDRLHHSRILLGDILARLPIDSSCHPHGRWHACHLQAGAHRAAWQALLHL